MKDDRGARGAHTPTQSSGITFWNWRNLSTGTEGGVLWLGASHVLPARLAVCSELFQMVTGSGPSTWQVPSVSSFLDISALGI